MEVFSARLKWLRESMSLSQQDMADKLGLSQSYYGRFERNKGEPNLETLSKLPEILGQSIDFMLGVTDFTKNCQRINGIYEDASSSASILKYELQEIQLNPHSKILVSKDFDPDDPVSVKTKIEFLRKNLPLYEDRAEQAKTKVLNMLSEIPLVKESTIQEINAGSPFDLFTNPDTD
ncbi:helix-turn-helix domain-containing protein [Paenibacillus sp. FSL L8-0494]|uniref:helix-turn-helix domain-containing protein n=1 Tax=Paenibacillus sp. FSL L8-0494 TaxID=2975352 RepID=UPI0030F876F2